jgi:phosphotransferase system IIB component
MATEIDVKRIKKLIQEAEIKSAKAQGVIDNLEKQWQERYGEGSVVVAKKKLAELREKIEKQERKKEELETELENLYDWDTLEED